MRPESRAAQVLKWVILLFSPLIRPALYTRVWDVADYVVPPAENGAFFVATNVIITPNQTRGFCPEDNFDVKGVDCNPDPDACDAAFNAITITGKD